MNPPNLRAKNQWRAARDKAGEPAQDVIESLCGTFTICRSVVRRNGAMAEIFLAWRRRPRPETADLVGSYLTADEARDAVARYWERMTGREA